MSPKVQLETAIDNNCQIMITSSANLPRYFLRDEVRDIQNCQHNLMDGCFVLSFFRNSWRTM